MPQTVSISDVGAHEFFWQRDDGFPCRDELLLSGAGKCTCVPRNFGRWAPNSPVLSIPYGREFLKVSMAEPTSCFVVRSEHQYNGLDHQRTSVRKHLCTTDTAGFHQWTWHEAAGVFETWKVSFVSELHSAIENWLVALPRPNPALGEPPDNYVVFGCDDISVVGEIFARFAEAAYGYAKARMDALCENQEAIDTGNKTTRLQHELWEMLNEAIPALHYANDTITLDGTVLIEIAIPGFGDDSFVELRNCVINHWVDLFLARLTSPLVCVKQSPQEQYSRYVGFVDFRPISSLSPIALGLLKPPVTLAAPDRGRWLIQGHYAYQFGGPRDLKSSFYVMHDCDGGATCAQANAIMATGLLSDRGASIPGTYEVSSFAGNEATIATGPLDVEQILQVLSEEHCHVNAAFVGIPIRQDHGPRGISRSILLFERLAEAYLHARCPGVLLCDPHYLYATPGNPRARASVNEDTIQHSILVVGYSEGVEETITPQIQGTVLDNYGGRLLRNLVVHDPGHAPFINVPASRVWHACAKYDREEHERGIDESLNAVFVSPRDVKCSLFECVSHLQMNDENFRECCANTLDGTADYRMALVRPRQLRELNVNAGNDLPDLVWLIISFRIEDGERLAERLWMFDATLPEGHEGTVRSESLTDPSLLADPDLLADVAKNTFPESGAEYPVATMTSSSPWSINELISKVQAELDGNAFDLFLLRSRDIVAVQDYLQNQGNTLKAFGPKNTVLQGKELRDEIEYGRISALSVLAENDNIPHMVDWLTQEALRIPQGERPRIAAFATYFPQISNPDAGGFPDAKCPHSIGTLSEMAIVNCVKIAVGLKEQGFVDGDIIVEIVCGANCARETRHDPNRLISECLAPRLKHIVNTLGDMSYPWSLSCECEPGSTYLLNSRGQIDLLFAELEDGDNEVAQRMLRHVGLNLDIAHMVISGIGREELKPLSHRIAHAHIADHPGDQHYRDQCLGRSSRIYSEDIELLRLYEEARLERMQSDLPYSGHVSIELEGNSRFNWIRGSYRWLRCQRAQGNI